MTKHVLIARKYLNQGMIATSTWGIELQKKKIFIGFFWLNHDLTRFSISFSFEVPIMPLCDGDQYAYSLLALFQMFSCKSYIFCHLRSTPDISDNWPRVLWWFCCWKSQDSNCIASYSVWQLAQCFHFQNLEGKTNKNY